MTVCAGVHQRKELTQALDRAVNPLHKQVHEYTGSEAELVEALRAVISGAEEWLDGGRAMNEACTCGNASEEQKRHKETDVPDNFPAFLRQLADPEYEGEDIP